MDIRKKERLRENKIYNQLHKHKTVTKHMIDKYGEKLIIKILRENLQVSISPTIIKTFKRRLRELILMGSQERYPELWI